MLNNLASCSNSNISNYIFSKLLLLYSANFGIYVMPQMNAIDSKFILILVWHGVVFVRYGIFKDGKFKFRMVFENFPKRPPKVYFMN